ncbi:MAG: hypothetical protein JWL69_1092 [Phycisphaerales bacterium]|jgi:hypothetical protein|nr:hypothetical protein [Phycisphaerales bacterium]MDB5357604.1 hypothetical protein [Phycisphaerales bacterium]
MQGFMIQLDYWPDRFDLALAKTLFGAQGVRLDEEYGVVVINARRGRRYLLRGWASDTTRSAVEEAIPGVRFSVDLSTRVNFD